MSSVRSALSYVILSSRDFPTLKERGSSYPYISGDTFRAMCPKRCERPKWEDAACNFGPTEVWLGLELIPILLRITIGTHIPR